MDNSIDNEGFIPVEKPVEDKLLPTQPVDATIKSASSTHSVRDKVEFTPLPNNVGQDQNNVIEHQDVGKPYNFFKPDGEETHVSEGMKQMRRDIEHEQNISERIQNNRKVIGLLENEKKFEGAFRAISLPNGSKALVFEEDVINHAKGELPSSLGIAKEYQTPKSDKEILEDKRSFTMFTEEGRITVVTGSTLHRDESVYRAIYEAVLHVKKEFAHNEKTFGIAISNRNIGLPTISDSGGVTGKETEHLSAEDANFYQAMYTENSLGNTVDTPALLRKFAEASKFLKERVSLSDFQAMIDEIEV